MNNGWIKLHRSLLDWEWYDDANTFRLFLHCLLKANHAEKKYRGKVVKRGTFLTGRELLAEETGLTVRQVRTSLDRLKSTNELTIKSSRQGTVVEVVNYDEYQAATNETTNERPTSDQRATSNKNEKKEKNEKKFTPPTLEEFVAHATEKLPKLNDEWCESRATKCATQRYETYVADNWRDGNGKAIKNWKTKAINSMKFEKPWNYGATSKPKTIEPWNL